MRPLGVTLIRPWRFATSGWNKLSATARAAILLALVLIAFTAPFFFEGKQFSPMDVLYRYYPWKAVVPDGYTGPSNGLRWDDATKFYPNRINLLRNFQRDGVTFWQNDHLAGTPNRPTVHRYGLLFYPLIWLFFVLPFNTANSLIHILNLYIAGFSMWLLLKEHRLSFLPALFGSIVYMLNGYFVVWMSAFFLPGILALLPLALFLYKRYIDQGKFLHLVLVTLIVAIQFYLGYPPGSILFVAFLGLYLMISLVGLVAKSGWREAGRIAGKLGAMIILAFGLAALYLAPTITQLVNSEYMVARASRSVTLLQWPLLLGFLFPDHWGNPTREMGALWLGGSNYCEVIAYWGIVPLMVASLGFFRRKKQGALVTFATLSFVLGLIMAYNIEPLQFLQRIPGLSAVTPARWQYGIVLAGSLFSALGLEHLLAKRNKRQMKDLVVSVLVVAGIGFLVLHVVSLASLQERFPTSSKLVDAHYRQGWLAVTGFVLLILFSVVRKHRARTILAVLIIALTLVDLFSFGAGFNPYIEDEELYPSTPGIRFLQHQDGTFRIAPWGSFPGVFPANTANVYGLSTITGMNHYRDLSYRAFLEPLMSEKAISDAQRYGYINIDQNISENQGILDLLNVRYVVTSPNTDLAGAYEPVYLGPDMRIYESLTVMPQTWGVSQISIATSQDALARIQANDFDPRSEAILYRDPGVVLGACESQELESRVVAYAEDEIVIQTDFGCDGVLMLAERFDDGWQVSLDGERVDLMPADYLLGAVAVPEGQHLVRVEYRPAMYQVGLALGLFSLMVLCGLAGFHWKQWRGATILGIVIPLAVYGMFAKPFKKPLPLAVVDNELDNAIVPLSQPALLKDEAGVVQFLGYELDSTQLSPGESVSVFLYWMGGDPLKRDYTVFVHLVDEKGQRWAQADKMPLNGGAPTHTWQDGQMVLDKYVLTVNEAASTSPAHVVIGMYDAQTMERVAMYDVDGKRIEGDALVLNTEIMIAESSGGKVEP